MSFLFSFLLPTRGRPERVLRFLRSIADTAAHPEDLEVMLAVDDDDLPSHHITHPTLRVKTVIVPRGLTMGNLNRACYGASTGRFVMLINDDVVIRSKDWDLSVAAALARIDDDIALIHVNDLLFQDNLCTFPILSRRACDAIGVCAAEYRRYRLDDHIYDIYNLLAYLGHKRILYLEDVIFEHENHTSELTVQGNNAATQLFEASSNKVYLPDQGIIAIDIAFFDSTFAQRKQAALTLAGLIHGYQHDRQLDIYRHALEAIHEPLTYRRPDFITRLKTGSSTGGSTVTIAVVTSNLYMPFAQRCIQAIKAHTQNFELIILDNNGSKDFNHPREMNKVLQVVKTDYLVLMDDDVFVEADWLDNLLRSLDDQTGVVSPMHKDGTGVLSYTGVYFKGDNLGTHAHTSDIPVAPRVAQALCSALLLINLKKCGHVQFDPAYTKYFLDIDYSLRVWEAGYNVVVTPYATVTHLGGGTTMTDIARSHQCFVSDQNIFIERWIRSGRLARIEQDIWTRYEYLRGLLAVPQAIRDTMPGIKLIETVGEYNLVQVGEQFMALSWALGAVDPLRETLGTREIPGLLLIGQDLTELRQRVAALQPPSFSPIALIEEVGEYNLVQVGEQFMALSKTLGQVDLLREALGTREIPGLLLIGQDLVELRQRMAALLGANVST